MSDLFILVIAACVFICMLIGIVLTVYELHKAGSEPVRPGVNSGMNADNPKEKAQDPRS
ncbi:hypothetical protein [Microbulbifer spongiae]|uniref:Uncharacterized protein n=1 Tax=Microbulbifer spongiae TaxID=2944933 RepID=A0ABY9EEX3_9GAMM|nr:hypothetical protein [Microbulbifer sp. MI-G]WKD49910.1 hypothetical protein M8T91_00325 [Microbulbifer sp. MI-G]